MALSVTMSLRITAVITTLAGLPSRLSLSAKLFMMRVMPDGGQGRHVKRLADGGAACLDMAGEGLICRCHRRRGQGQPLQAAWPLLNVPSSGI